MQAEKIVAIIPPDPSLLREQKRQAKKLRVAAHCRVSTDQDEQQSSYEVLQEIAHGRGKQIARCDC